MDLFLGVCDKGHLACGGPNLSDNLSTYYAVPVLFMRQRIISFACHVMERLTGHAGMVGFGQDLGATRSLASSDESGQAMEATAAAMLEADRRITDPFRPYKFWRKARAHMLLP